MTFIIKLKPSEFYNSGGTETKFIEVEIIILSIEMILCFTDEMDIYKLLIKEELTEWFKTILRKNKFKKNMFKVGDKVVCIDDSGNFYLVEDEIYIIDKVIRTDFGIVLCFEKNYFNSDRFITLQEDRERKLNKIITKING